MKIGIITTYSWFKSTHNYGSGLQTYAMIYFLRKKGHDAFLICNTTGIYPELKYSGFFSRCGHYIYRYYIALQSWVNRRSGLSRQNPEPPEKNLAFTKFLDSCVPHTDEMSGEQVESAPPEADAYIAGSDQIWQGVNALNFLSFAPPGKKTIIYAASSAWTSLDKTWKNTVKTLIHIPQHVSVREDAGLSVCREMGRKDGVLVCDPTLLLMPDQYRTEIKSQCISASIPEHTLLVYLLNIKNGQQMHQQAIQALSQQSGTEIRMVPCQGSRPYIASLHLYEPAPLEWCSAIDQAQYVLTNSYHGTIFSILMHTPFLVMPQTNKESAEHARFESLLHILGLEDRICDPAQPLFAQMSSSIDWNDVDARLSVFRKQSADFLLKALS